MVPRTVISYGGGVQSTALVVLAARERWHIDAIIHVDLLDAEAPDTRAYVRAFNNWVHDQFGFGITFLQSDLVGDMLAYPAFVAPPFLAKDGSFMLKRQCTAQYKIRPFYDYLARRYDEEHINLMVGISADEWHRMRDSDASFITNVYPLVERMLTRSDCRKIIREAGLQVPQRSSCWFCPYRRAVEQDRIVAKYPYLESLADEIQERVNEVRRERGKQEIIVLKRSRDVRQLDMWCDAAGWCDD